MNDKKEFSVEEMKQDRAGLKSLLARNVNYFGNAEASAPAPVKKLISNRTFEELNCVGFNPATGTLEATIAIKQPSGYAGDVCHAGSLEYVRFYVDNGSGWQDAGLAAVSVHDIPTNKDCGGKADKPLLYVASLKYDRKTKCCKHPSLPNVRAILSWNWAPPANTPGWLPVWGNRHEAHVQLKPGPFSFLCLFEDLKIDLPPKYLEIAEKPVPIPDPGPLKLGELAQTYSAQASKEASKAVAARFAVEPQRFGAADLHLALSEGSFDQELMSNKATEWKELGLDWGKYIDILGKTKSNTDYEQLECLGLDEGFPERLVATFRIKKPAGYNGNLCTKGSQEYVAFWADWDDKCEWTYLGTQAVNVHDFSALPAGGLSYSAIQMVDLTEHRRGCSNPKIARVRAVLSWSVPPSTTDPDELKYYGNRLDTHVQITPGPVGDPNKLANIRIIGGIAIENINTAGNGMTKTVAFGGGPVKFAENVAATADGWGLNRQCPFGGLVIVKGNFLKSNFLASRWYRLSVRNVTTNAAPVPLAYDFELLRSTFFGTDPVPRVGDWFKCMDPDAYFGRELGYWFSGGDDLWEVSMEVANVPGGVVLDTAGPFHVQLDNTAPKAPPAPSPDIDIHLTSVGDCKDVTEFDSIDGMFIADDLHFGGWSLSTEPNTVTFPSNPPKGPGGVSSGTTPYPGPAGAAWHLDTASPVKMKPCGYVVRLVVSDRTIVSSSWSSHNSNAISVGFCLRSKK